MRDAKMSQSTKKNVYYKRISFAQLIELSFWGTIIWGIFRLFGHFLRFTSYSVGSFARPFFGLSADHSVAGNVVGSILLFVGTLAASLLYSLFFSRVKLWWGGLVYGLIFLLIIGFFFRMGNWSQGTLSTEIVWFLSYGLFIGMTISLEQRDQE